MFVPSNEAIAAAEAAGAFNYPKVRDGCRARWPLLKACPGCQPTGAALLRDENASSGADAPWAA